MKTTKDFTLKGLAKSYHSEEAAREALESLRWPEGVVCPRCGSMEVTKVAGGRAGLYRCKDCRRNKTKDQFTVGTVFQDSHIKQVWYFAVPTVSAQTLKEVLLDNVHPTSRLMTDELAAYEKVGQQFKAHDTFNHGKFEYVRGKVATNTVEGFFGPLNRGINGTFHHVSKEHLHRYLAEFDFRYNARKVSDHERTMKAIAGFEGRGSPTGD